MSDIRPKYVIENREDWLYHDYKVDSEPEFCALGRRIWVFNRSMKWLEEEGCILCYSEAGNLYLTGEDQASTWHSDPENSIEESGDFTRFTKVSTKRRVDAAVLPAFQFNLYQHPKIELTVSDATDDWQFCIFIKGRSGPPIVSSEWKREGCTLTFDIAAELKDRGYNLQFAELHFVIGTWSKNTEASSSITFRLRLLGQSAVVPCLPVIRTIANASKNGVPIVAVVLNEQGELLRSDDLTVYASIGGQRIPLEEKDGVWKTKLHGLKEGEYEIELVTEGMVQKRGIVHVRVTDGRFFSYDKQHHSIMLNGKNVGPLSGSGQITLFFKDVGLVTEEMVQGQEDWDSWDRTKPPGEHWHYWEALTEKELDERAGYLKKCGWNILYLITHWGFWERLDAGGRIAPHGAEQLALFIRVAARHGLIVAVTFTHYPYATPEETKLYGTIPFSRYLDAGFKPGDWDNPESSFTEMFHEYLRHFVSLFKEESALFGISTSGEGDYVANQRVNDTYNFIQSLDKNHIFLSEPILHMTKLPQEYRKGWQPELIGSRTYWIGVEVLPEFDLGIEFQFMQLGNLFMAEGSWIVPPKYAALHNQDETWCGKLRYRIRVRDSIYLGLVHRIPIILTWDEQITEDERIVFEEIRKLVDWNQSFLESKVALQVDGTNVTNEERKNLAEYEKAFVSMPLAYKLILPDDTNLENIEVIIDARLPFQAPRFESDGGFLQDSLKEYMPLRISEGYCVSYVWSKDKQTFLAYIYNTTNHIQNVQKPYEGKLHRMPEPVDLKITLQNFPKKELKYRVYDLNNKILYKQGSLRGRLDIDFRRTHKDYFVAITPS